MSRAEPTIRIGTSGWGYNHWHKRFYPEDIPPLRDGEGVFEFRHKSWYDEDTFKLLAESGAAFCIHDLGGLKTPRVITGDVIYIRFHGPTGRYAGNYTKKALKDWATWIKENISKVTAVYTYFNNDYNAYAVNNAKTLKGQF